MSAEYGKGSPKGLSLQVGIVGAGIAGLSAAIGLARAGHQVEVFEKSRFASEIGAAINVCPNATRILSRWNFDFEKWHPTVARGVRVRNEETQQDVAVESYSDFVKEFGYTYYLYQRVDLHAGLKEQAASLGVVLQLASETVDISCEEGIIHKNDGKTYQKDLIVVADGVHANFTSKIAGRDASATHTGQNAFRWQISEEQLLGSPLTKQFCEASYPGINIACTSSTKRTRLVWYPCKGGKIFNFTGIHPQKQRNMHKKHGWGTSGTVADLLETYKSFGDRILAVCRNAEHVKVWPLFAQQPLETWTRGKAVAIGDAIHAMMPHHGQGGAQAIEDGAALGVLFSRVTSASDVPTLLQLFQDLRKGRASALQILSSVGQDEAWTREKEVQPYIKGSVPKTYEEIHQFNFSYDVMSEARELLIAKEMY